MHSPHLKKAKELWAAHIRPGDFVVDATCGNGHDTLFLSQLARHVYGIDLQEQAIANTKKRLQAHWGDRWSEKISLYCRSHEDLDWIPEAPRLVVYNLGYLPHGDKSLTTRTETTLLSLESALRVVAQGGAVCVTCYPGHEEGEREEKAVMKLGGRYYTWLDRPKAPSLVWFDR